MAHPPAGAVRAAPVQIRVLGPFAVLRDGAEVDRRAFGGRLTRLLIRILASRAGRPVPRELLCDQLWPRDRPADPGANLNALVHRARKAVGDPLAIRTLADGYLLDLDRCVVDAEAFLAAARTGCAELDRGRPGEALRRLDDALATWSSAPLPEDEYAEWAADYRAELVDVRWQAMEGAAEAALALGDMRRAVRRAEQLTRERPLDEPAHRLLTRARMAAGDRAGALAVLDAVTARLADELGVEPVPETCDLRLRVLRDQPMLPERPPPRPAERGPLHFVGRDEELVRLLTLTRQRRGSVALVSGHAGAGKSRLLAELVGRCALPTLAARAFLPERVTPWGLARSLLRQVIALDVDAAHVVPAAARGALADLVPDLPVPTPAAHFEPETRRALVLEAGLRLLAAATAGGALILVDDLQWADASSVQLLASAAHRLDGVAFVLAYRPEEVAADSEVGTLLAQLRAAPGGVTVSLGRLAPAALETLVADPALVAVLARETDGSPFAIGEALSALEAEGLARPSRAGVWRGGSPVAVDRARQLAREGQLRSVAERAERQDPPCRQVLSCLALLGREVSDALIAAALSRTEAEVLRDLDALARADLVRVGERGWAPAHDLIGETVADRLSPGERADLSRRLAAALEGQPAAPGERARHLLAAGNRVAAARTLAAEARLQLARHANAEAGRLAEVALDLEPSEALRPELLAVRAEAAARAGRLDSARDDLRSALALSDFPPHRAGLLARLAMLASGAEDPWQASELAELAVVEAGTDPAARARALSVAAIVDMNLEQHDRATIRAAEALQLYRDIGDGHGVADILDAQAMALFLDGQVGHAIERFDRVARLYADLGDLLRVVTPRSTRGHGLLFAGRPDLGLPDMDRAVRLACELGSSDGEAYARWQRSEVLTGCGRIQEAVDEALHALRVAQQMAHRGWTVMALRALGIARHAAGDLPAAEEAFRASSEKSAQLSLFRCWTHARLGLLLIDAGRLDEAAEQVTAALSLGPPLAQYEARLAEAKLAVARCAPDADRVVSAALAAARVGGHGASERELAQLMSAR